MSEEDKPRGEVKAKLPAAKNIRSPEFTPHGISGGNRSRGPRPSGKTAAQAKRQRRIAITLAVVAVLAITGGTTYYLTRPGPMITATGPLGKAPNVRIPKDLVPGGELETHTAIKGSGPKIAKGDTAMVKFMYYQWSKGSDENANESTNEKKVSTWEQQEGRRVVPMTIGESGLKGLDKGLVGATAGSRVILEIPPKDGFGDQGQQMGLSATDSLVFVVDILANFPKDAKAQGTAKELDDENLPKVEAGKAGEGPKITIPEDTDPPGKLQDHTLIEGGGRALTKQDVAVVKYKGLIWRDGKEIGNSFKEGVPVTPSLSAQKGSGMEAMFLGLEGHKIGSRVMLIVPPGDGFGEQGNPQLGVKGGDTVVLVVDVLGTMPK